MRSPLNWMPAEWFTQVTVIRSGGRDRWGNLQPEKEIPVADCLIGPSSTDESEFRSDRTDTEVVLLRSPGFTFLSTDRIRIPDGARMAGEWAVNGRPGEWPYGWKVELK